MCCRVVIYEVEEGEYRRYLKEILRVQDDTQIDMLISYNISPGSFLPVVYNDIAIKAEGMKWGLVPFWTNDEKTMLFNARLETVDLKATFKESFNTRRCIIPIKGYYEWKEDKGIKTPYYFHSEDNTLLPLAGLYQKRKVGTEIKHEFTILTKLADPDIAHIHDRMPVILDQKDLDIWLDPDQNVIDLKKRLISEHMKLSFYKVDQLVNSTRNDSKQLIERIDN